MEKVFVSNYGGAKGHNICTMRLGTREKYLRGKHNPSANLLQPCGGGGAGFGLRGLVLAGPNSTG
jgi:hypothetical protein